MIPSSSYPYNLQKMTLQRGEEIVYTDTIQGEQCLVFLHGLASYMPVWMRNISYFREQYRCVALDLPGHGLSSRGAYSYSISFYMEVVYEWLKRLQIKKAILVGHSMGGQIAVKLITQYPLLFSHLVLVAPAGFERFTGLQKTFLSHFAPAHAISHTQYLKFVLNLKNSFYGLEEKEYLLFEELNRDYYSIQNIHLKTVMEKSIRGMLNEPIFQLLPKIIQPTLVIFGEDDRLIPNRLLSLASTQDIALEACAQIRNHQLRMIPESGHLVQYEKADICNESIRDFIAPKG
jgi:pimeloyl-ACP methyl ester carboxylesterase